MHRFYLRNYCFLNKNCSQCSNTTYTSTTVIIYATISSKSIVISFSDARCVEDFKGKFTTLDAGIASRAIFSMSVAIKYSDKNLVELIPEGEFTYCDVNTMVGHMLRHGFTFKQEVLSSILEQASALATENFVVLKAGERSSYIVGVYQDTITVSPLTSEYLDLESGPSQRLVKLLRTESAISSVNVDAQNRSITILVRGNVCDALGTLCNVMITIGAIEAQEKGAVLVKLVRLAFLDLMGNEIRSVRNIASCSVAHPLSKYKGVARTIENILTCLSNKTLDAVVLGQLEDALEGKGEFSALPSVLTKGFVKLNRDFNGQLENIIGSEKRVQ
ncbi:hypothetical protein ANAPH1_00064 [Anaplasma phagocytophilum]|nr:hypothetical protein ANAPH1_00064 [Anaplasma phagocytophilum]